MSQLSDFIGSERQRFANEDNNRFAMSFSQITRYYEFIRIVFSRYEEASALFFSNTKAIQATISEGTHSLTATQLQLHEEGVQLTILLHLEIESFYLFSKILLDKIAHSLEFFFGGGRRKSLDSHDALVKNFSSYAELKMLTLPVDFMKIAGELKKDISDYRDYEIAHEKSPRRVNATVFDEHGTMHMAGSRIHPNEKEQHVESKALHELMNDIDSYVTQVIELIKLNASKTNLKTE
jgi:hypothetical protein